MPPANYHASSLEHRPDRKPFIFRQPSAFEKSCLIESVPVMSMQYLRDHRVAGKVIYPAAGFCMAGIVVNKALRKPAGKFKPMLLENLRFRRSLSLSGQNTTVLRLSYKPQSSEFTVNSARGDYPGGVTPHALGTVTGTNPELSTCDIDLDRVFKRCLETIDVSYFYQRLRQSGLNYGQFFKRIVHVRVSKDTGEAITQLAGHPGLTNGWNMSAQPVTLLDCAFQSLAATLDNDHFNLHVPSRIRALRVYADFEANLWCHARLTNSTNRAITGDIRIFNNKRLLMAIDGLRCLKIKQRHVDRGNAEIACWNKPLIHSNNFQQQLSSIKSGDCNVEY